MTSLFLQSMVVFFLPVGLGMLCAKFCRSALAGGLRSGFLLWASGVFILFALLPQLISWKTLLFLPLYCLLTAAAAFFTKLFMVNRQENYVE